MRVENCCLSQQLLAINHNHTGGFHSLLIHTRNRYFKYFLPVDIFIESHLGIWIFFSLGEVDFDILDPKHFFFLYTPSHL